MKTEILKILGKYACKHITYNIEYIDEADFEHIAEEVEKRFGWQSVHLDKLPKIDQPALWLYKAGGIIYESLNHDMDEVWIKYFLAGNEVTGPIIGWMDPEILGYPKEAL